MIAERTRAVINTLSVSAANEGTRTMLTELVPALARVAPDVDLVLLGSSANQELFGNYAGFHRMRAVAERPTGRILADQLSVPWISRKLGDVLVTPSSVASFFSPIPQVVIVSAHLALPSCQVLAGEGFVGARHRLYYGSVLRTSLRRARVVLPISAFVGQGLVHELGIDERRVTSMPLGVVTRVVSDQPTTGAPMVLFVGTLYEYKEARTALRAFLMARSRLPDDARLVIVGREFHGNETTWLHHAASDAGAASAVDIVGSVDDERLQELYRSATALIMPSRCEGFGLPVAEAMSFGVPPIIADATALPEVAGEAGTLVAPGDVAGFADAIVRIVTNPNLHAELAAKSTRRARELTWDASARILAQAIRRAKLEGSLNGRRRERHR